eukprot:1499532-Rhodomonas_salina.2
MHYISAAQSAAVSQQYSVRHPVDVATCRTAGEVVDLLTHPMSVSEIASKCEGEGRPPEPRCG